MSILRKWKRTNIDVFIYRCFMALSNDCRKEHVTYLYIFQMLLCFPFFYVYYCNYLNKSTRTYRFSSLLCMLIDASNTKRKKSNYKMYLVDLSFEYDRDNNQTHSSFISFLFWQDRTAYSMLVYELNLNTWWYH
jgi:hypothetical protein